MGKVGEEAGSRETSINDAKKSENGDRVSWQEQGNGMGHARDGEYRGTIQYGG